MAVLVKVLAPDITTERYDRIVKQMKLETDLPRGLLFHVAAVTPRGLEVTDIWDSEQHFQRFAESRLKPTFQQLGFSPHMEISISSVHKILAPAFALQSEFLGADWSQPLGA